MRKPAYVLIAATLLLAASAAKADEVRDFHARGLKTLTIDSMQGQVTFEGKSDTDTVEVRFGSFDDPSHCEIKTENTKGRITITARAKQKPTLRDKCRISIAVSAPRETNLDVRLGTGSFTVKDLFGAITFTIGSGNAQLSGLKTSQLKGRTGSGDVSVQGVIEEADLKVGAGNVSLKYENPAAAQIASGSLNVKVGSGSTTVFLPESAKVASEFRSGTGSLTNEFPQTADAKFRISGSSGTGDMLIKKI